MVAATPSSPDSETPDPGLCSSCRHVRIVRSGRGSTFHLCRRAGTDPAFPRYPRLPMLACPGHESGEIS